MVDRHTRTLELLCPRKVGPWSSFGRAGGSPRMQVREDQPVGRHAPVVCALAGDDAELLWMRGGDRGEWRSCQRRGDFARRNASGAAVGLVT